LHYDLFTVTCNLDVTESGAVRTIPEGKNIFKAGETVGIFCSAKNPFFHNQEKFTCTNNGKWDYKPTCEGKNVEKHSWIWC